MLLAWMITGWILGVAYFWGLFDDPWTWVLTIVEGAFLGPLVIICFMLEPPNWLKD